MSDVPTTQQHLVRVGVMGNLAHLHAHDATRYPRRTRVVCRTARGLELGEILNFVERQSPSEGTILRAVTVEDELLESRLRKHRDEAFQACSQLISERQLSVTLLDVEHLFDGESLYFYFLGDTTPELDAITDQLAETYAAKVRFREFSQLLEQGCGPDCGTEAKGACGTADGCASCAAIAACRTARA
jgi:cell fate regulator YaaT (PSP1 superfamily)